MDREQMLAYVRALWDDAPEYLWAREPAYYVLRHGGNRKWYAVGMTVPRARLSLPGDGAADILNVKCGPLLMGSYRGKPGVLPGYHMNKSHWLTLLLDGTAARPLIEELLQISYDLTRE